MSHSGIRAGRWSRLHYAHCMHLLFQECHRSESILGSPGGAHVYWNVENASYDLFQVRKVCVCVVKNACVCVCQISQCFASKICFHFRDCLQNCAFIVISKHKRMLTHHSLT